MSDDTDPSAPPGFVVHVDHVPETPSAYPAPWESIPLSSGRDLGAALGTRTLGVYVDSLAPGRQTSLTHAHSDEEELAFVLSGACTLHVVHPDGRVEDVPLRAGHAASFPAGTGIAHCFRDADPSAGPCVLLVIGERRPGVDRVTYPEHPEFEAWLRSRRPERVWAPVTPR